MREKFLFHPEYVRSADMVSLIYLGFKLFAACVRLVGMILLIISYAKDVCIYTRGGFRVDVFTENVRSLDMVTPLKSCHDLA